MPPAPPNDVPEYDANGTHSLNRRLWIMDCSICLRESSASEAGWSSCGEATSLVALGLTDATRGSEVRMGAEACRRGPSSQISNVKE